MKDVHRIEIVVDAPLAGRVLELLEAEGLTGYSVIRSVAGSGERGLRHGDDITGISNNNYILTTCPPEKLDALAASLRPLLDRIGGICLISEARSLRP